MKKVLFIVTEINSANGICTKAVMKELSDNGYKVFCIINKELDLPEGSFEKAGISYSTVKPRLVYRLSSVINKQENGLRKKALSIVTMILNKAKMFLSIPSWPLISPLYSIRIYNQAKKLCEKENIDIIIPIYTQVDTLIAAKLIKKKKPEIKYCPYFLDSMSGGYGPKIFSKEWVIKRGLKWEKRLLDSTDKIIMMKSSEEHHKIYSKNREFYKNMVFLDLPLFIPSHESGLEIKKTEGIVDILYIGTIPVNIRNPERFLQAFKLIKDDRYRLTIVGTNTCPGLIEAAVKDDKRIKVMPFVDHDTAKKLMKSADFLVNFGNNQASMTPSKIFEYMSIGKPIISTAPIENEPSTPYLKQYPCAYVMKEYEATNEELARELEAFLIHKKDNQINVDSLNEVFYLNTPKAFLSEIDCI